MGRTLKPHGTYAAYRRHLSRKEQPCPSCKDANAKYQSESRARKMAEAVEVSQTPVEAAELPEIDEEKILRESLAALRAHQQVAEPREAASIAKGIRDTLAALSALNGAQSVEPVKKGDVFDEIAKRRRQRASSRGATATG